MTQQSFTATSLVTGWKATGTSRLTTLPRFGYLALYRQLTENRLVPGGSFKARRWGRAKGVLCRLFARRVMQRILVFIQYAPVVYYPTAPAVIFVILCD